MRPLICLIFLCPVLIFSQQQTKYQGLLWKISGKGTKKPSYLYGTMHVSNRVAYYLSEQFFDALKNVEVVGLETNPGEWLENMEKTGELSQLSQFRGTDYYGRDFYKSTFSPSFPEKRMLQGVLSYDPDIIDGLLYRQNKTKENFEENTYIDLFIFQTASKLNKEVISLEDFTQSEIQARLSALPDDDAEETEGSYKDYYSGGQRIEDAYRDGNLDLLDSLSKLSSSKNTQRYLIDNRNVFFANTIDSVLKTKSLFGGVGAAHLPGENGVIELLRKRGYTVEPVEATISKKSNALREEMDLKIKPVIFKKQTVSDSVFSVNLPGTLSTIVNSESLKYYIYADMVNGSFYTIVRLKYLGPLFNITSKQMMQKIDSLLFEYVPGKIISKKEVLSSAGIKGIELVNRTRKGDEQHYQIFFTDLEMIMFKLGGKHQYATGQEAKQFFNSIQFTSKPENNIEFSPETKGFRVKLPANYTYAKNDGASVIGLVEDLHAYAKKNNEFMGVKHAVYNDFNYLEEDTFELNQFSKNILVNYDFKQSTFSENRTELGFPCVRFSGTNKNNTNFYGKLFIKGVHYYFVYFISGKTSSFDNDFFKSFELMDYQTVNPLKQITDDELHFKVQDEVSDNALSRFNELYAKAYKEVIAVKNNQASKNSDFDFNTKTKFYYSPSSNEYVNIIYEKYNDYDYRDAKMLDERITKGLSKNTGMRVDAKITSFVDSTYTYKCILKDTATTRAIDLRIFLKNGTMYEISTPFDTTVGLKGWAKGFMETFAPKDTVIGKNIFRNKFGVLLEDLTSADTAVRQRANISLQNSVEMQKEFTEDFVNFISGKKLGLVNENSRAQLFVNGGTIESDKIIAPYKELYKQYTDSFYLQLCLLKGLAYLKTQNSYNAFYDLLMSETPLVGAENTVSDIFTVLHDSLELGKKFFPGFLTLTKYDEYRESVYSLMADLVNKKILSPQTYTLQKDGILADATLALKRFNSSSTKISGQSGDAMADYYAKELAESIQSNLQGLTYNNLYKGSNYLRNIEAYNRPVLVNYTYILSPFYKTDEKVKQFFSKVSKLKNQNIAMPVAINLLKQNVVINDTLIPYYSKNKITRAFFYSELEKEKLSDKFDKDYLSQSSLIESVLSSQKQLSNFYTNDKDKSRKDSLVLIREVEAKNKYQSGRLYVYKSYKSKNDEEQWSVAFINSKEKISSKIEVISSNFTVDKTKSEEENLKELMNYFYLSFRKRTALNAERGVN